jgi:hypothetical protein
LDRLCENFSKASLAPWVATVQAQDVGARDVIPANRALVCVWTLATIQSSLSYVRHCGDWDVDLYVGNVSDGKG